MGDGTTPRTKPFPPGFATAEAKRETAIIGGGIAWRAVIALALLRRGTAGDALCARTTSPPGALPVIDRALYPLLSKHDAAGNRFPTHSPCPSRGTARVSGVRGEWTDGAAGGAAWDATVPGGRFAYPARRLAVPRTINSRSHRAGDRTGFTKRAFASAHVARCAGGRAGNCALRQVKPPAAMKRPSFWRTTIRLTV
ncbi:hypothetical protein KCP73_20950 [Salmonella enterica subsp. enterica]|nr:hypothetical protein KCP73_20950 [Salmonella enterica subsp. enterica]